MALPITAADPDVVLRADDVDLVRGGRLLLDQVSFAVRSGELWALLGPNGAGKSTLLRLLATYAHPTRGHVDILGSRLGRVDVFTLRPQVALASSHHPVQAARTVREVVLTGATGTIEPAARWVPTAADQARAEEVLAVLGLARLAGARWLQLSQGERARTLIARVLMGQPRVLLLDEPAAGLDVAGREQLLASIDQLRDAQPGLATVLVTHHLEELPSSTTHALLLRDGQLLGAGPVGDVLTSDLVSSCFAHPLTITRQGGRWRAEARPGG
ncbi:MAG TPA: ATP-binding cassette domain-containing protein [Streptosporangiaceae bacterium]